MHYAIIHTFLNIRFRYDGIVDVQNAAPGVLPIVAEKVESDKFRMQWRLISGTAADFPESSLTLEEKVRTCTFICNILNTCAYTQTVYGSVRFGPLGKRQ